MDAGDTAADEWTAHLELQTGLLRVFDPGREFGQEYARVWSVVRIDDVTAEFRGATVHATRDQLAAVGRCLQRAGFAWVQWKRKKGGREVVRRYHVDDLTRRPPGEGEG